MRSVLRATGETLLAPVAEEAFFRGHLFASIREKPGPVAAVITTAALFSAVHLHPVASVVYFGYGLVFAWARERTGYVTAPMMAHALTNTAAISLLLH